MRIEEAFHSLKASEIELLLEPYLDGVSLDSEVYAKLSAYLDLILKWNARTNLTAIRDAPGIVRRHFGESLFAGLQVGECETMLDFGSGAGFPGLPIQLLRPQLRVALAESQNKKASFLREAVRTLSLGTEVWAGRVEAMPETRRFDVVTMRAVDHMEAAVEAAAKMCSRRLVVLATSTQVLSVPHGFVSDGIIAIPMTRESQVVVLRRST